MIFPRPPIPPLPPPPIPPSYSQSLISSFDLTSRQQLYAQFLQFYIFKYSAKNGFKTCQRIGLQNLNYLNNPDIKLTKIQNSKNINTVTQNNNRNFFLKTLTNSQKYLVNNFIIPTSIFFILILVLLIAFIVFKK